MMQSNYECRRVPEHGDAEDPQSSGVREKMLTNYIEPTPTDTAAFRAMVVKQLDVSGVKVKAAGIHPE